MNGAASVLEFSDLAGVIPVRGFLHVPPQANGDGLILTHGAGADCRSRLLTSLAGAFAGSGFTVLRCNLPFRQKRPQGPPFPAQAADDREGLRRAAQLLRAKIPGRLFLAGHSYGGRQATILASEAPGIATGLLLLSFPLHPPRKPQELRTAHFPRLATPALFVHGSRDPFGSLSEMENALKIIQCPVRLVEIEGSGHDLLPRTSGSDLPARIVKEFQEFFRCLGSS